MSGLRTLLSALCIVVGALLGAAWLAATALVGTVEDGGAAGQVSQFVADDPQVLDAAADAGTERVVEALRGAGVDFPGLDAIVAQVVSAAVHSEAFTNAVRAQAESAGEQLVSGVTSGSGPLVVMVDISEPVNDGLGAIPLVGPRLPHITIPPIPVQVASEDQAQGARDAYDRVEWVANWAGWLALTLIAAGLLISHRRRWYLAKAALAVGVACGLGWALATFGDPGELVAALPGGLAGTAPGEVVTMLADHASESVASVLGFAAIGAMIIAGVLLVVARATQGAGSKRG